MRQREFVTLVGAAAVGWPFAARAQQLAKLPPTGFLGPNSATFDKAQQERHASNEAASH
jgi:hypothetical protein